MKFVQIFNTISMDIYMFIYERNSFYKEHFLESKLPENGICGNETG